jgi:hypothetical protein
MKAPSKPFKIFVAAFVLLALAGYMGIRAISSPRAILKHSLNIPSIPKSVSGLRMGSDVWTDEVRSFYLTIAPADFEQLVAGRIYQVITNADQFPATTMHISPPVRLDGHVVYKWETDRASCSVQPDDTHEHVIILFSAH